MKERALRRLSFQDFWTYLVTRGVKNPKRSWWMDEWYRWRLSARYVR